MLHEIASPVLPPVKGYHLTSPLCISAFRIMHVEIRDVLLFPVSEASDLGSFLRICFADLLTRILHLGDELICPYKRPLSNLMEG